MIILQGVRPLRQKWWIPLSLEPWFVPWRYLLLLECAEIINVFSVGKDTSQQPERILLVKLGHVGDYICFLPLLQIVQGTFWDCTDVLVGAWNRILAETYAFGAKCIPYTPCLEQYHRSSGNRCPGFFNELRMFIEMRQSGYHTVMLLENHHLLDMVLERFLNPRRIVKVEDHTQAFIPHLSEQVTIPFIAIEPEADWMRRSSAAIGLHSGPCVPFLITSINTKFEWPTEYKSGLLDPGEKWAVLSPGAGWPGKCWPVDSFIQTGRRIIESLNLCVAVVGSPEEKDLCDKIACALGEKALSLAGRTSLVNVARILKNAVCYIGNDNGIMHMAAAVGIPTVAVFGPTNAEKWAPQGSQHLVLQHRNACAFDCVPWHPGAVCRHELACMRAVTVDEVIQAVTTHCKQM
jgi:ADP-heptose:LPS heptosyltransferase